MSLKDMSGDVAIVKINGVGTVLKGLSTLFIEAKKKGLQGSELRDYLINSLKRMNALSKKDESELGEILLMKYDRFLKGEPDEVEKKSVVDIKILGDTCNCTFELEKQAMQAVIELDVEGPFFHVSDPKLIAEYGVVRMPALVINGKIVSMGRSVMKDEIKKMIKDSMEKTVDEKQRPE